jgi:hypothetical protein
MSGHKFSRQHFAKRCERLGDDPVVRPASALLALDQPCLEQHLEVVAHRRLAEPERPGQVTHAGLAARLRLKSARRPGTATPPQPADEALRLAEWMTSERGEAAGGRQHAITGSADIDTHRYRQTSI